MDERELKERTKQFALRVMKLVDSLPNSVSGRAIANQLVRAGTSVGANYRSACRGRSKAEFCSKLGTVVEESDECCFWLELIMDASLLPRKLVEPLHQEANELTAIFVSSIKTAKSSITNQKSPIHKSSITNQKSKMD
jgi:four helix bundle protein